MTTERFPGLQEKISLLDDELGLAYRWNRPSILLIIYKAEDVREEARKLLAKCIEQRGQKLKPMTINSENYDVALKMVNSTHDKETVFSVSNLGKGGGRSRLNAFRALNLRRELIIENHLRAIFWLTETEARQLARHAPDFWAFRHRMISLVDL